MESAEYRTIRVSSRGDVVSLVLDRPAVLNALSAEMLGELLGVLPEIEANGAKALVISGEGRAFCSGADLTSLSEDVDLGDSGDVRRHMGRWSDLILGIRNLPLPSIAAVAGPAYGGGCNLAASCDIVIAAESARFCQSYIDRGVTTDLGGSYLLARLLDEGTRGSLSEALDRERDDVAALLATPGFRCRLDAFAANTDSNSMESEEK